MRKRLTVLFAFLALALAAPAFGAPPRNQLQSITVTEDPAATLVRITGSETPTFNVFRLSEPPRLLIDIAAGDIGELNGTIEVMNGVITQIGTLAFSREGGEFARVIITFEKDVPYDVQARNGEILVVVDGEGRRLAARGSSEGAHLEGLLQREQALLEELKTARLLEEKLASEAREKRLAEEGLRQQIEEARVEAERYRAQAESAKMKAMEETDAVEAARLKALEEKAALDRLAQLEQERLESLRDEAGRLEAAREAAAALTEAELAKKAALERAVAMAEEARAAAELEQRKAEELKAAAEMAAVKEAERLEILRQQAQLESQRREAEERARLEESRRAELASESERAQRAMEANSGNEAEYRKKIEQLSAEMAAVQEALEQAKAEASRREAQLAVALQAGEENERAIAESAQARSDALNAKLEAARKAVEAEEARRAALEEANRQEELRLAAMREAREKELANENAEHAKEVRESQISEIKRSAAQLEAERKALEELAGRKDKLAKEVARTEQDRAKLERNIREAEARYKQQQEKLASLENERLKAANQKRGVEKELSQQKDLAEQLQAQLELEKESLKRLVAQRKDEERKVDRLRKEVKALESKKSAAQDKNYQQLKAELESREKALKDRTGALAGAEKKLVGLEKEMQALARKAEQSQERAKALEAEAARKEAEARRVEEENKALRGTVKRLEASAKTTTAVTAENKGHEKRIRELEGQVKAGDEARARAEQLKRELDAARKREAELARASKSSNSKLNEVARERDSLNAQLAQLKLAAERTAVLEAELKKLRTAMKSKGALEKELASTRDELDSARREAVKTSAAKEELEKARRLARRVQDLEAALKDSKAGKARVAELEREAAAARKAAEGVADTEERLARLEKLEQQNAELKGKATELEAQRSEVARLSAELAEAEKARAENDELKEELEEVKGELARLKGDAVAEARRADVESKRAAELEKQAQEASRRAAELEKQAAERKEAEAGAKGDTGRQARVTGVEFDESAGESQVQIRLQGKAAYRMVKKSSTEYELLLPATAIPAALERTLDTSDFAGPIVSVSSYRSSADPETTVVAVQLRSAAPHEVKEGSGGLVWSFQGGGKKSAKAAKGSGSPAGARKAVGVYPEGVGAGGSQDVGMPSGGMPVGGGAVGLAVSGGGDGAFSVLNPKPGKKKKKYTGKRINLSIKDADIQHVLAFLSRVGGVNIVTSEKVKGKVSFYLEDVPWDLALDMILKSSGLDYVKEQGIIRVAPVGDIQKEYEMELEKKKKMAELKQLQVKLIPVNYASAENMTDQIKGILSNKGSVSVDKRTNTLIVKDIEEHVTAIEDLVRRLDAQTPQVLIEARIVEASREYSKDLGIQWGGYAAMSPTLGNSTGLIFPASIGLAGGASDASATTSGLFTPANPNFAVNLPAATGQGAGGAIGMTLGSIGGAANLAIRLSAAESEGSVKIISAPKISTLDNSEATIQQGISFPVSVVSAQGVNTQFFDAQLQMRVTPHVTQDGNIMLKIQLTKNEPDFSQTGANGNPTIRRKEANTTLLLKDGDTTVIGGIYTRNSSWGHKKVPFLADLPLIGPLFKSSTEKDSRSELLIFVTPRIVNRQASKVRTDAD